MNKRFLAIAIAAGLAVSSNVMAEGVEVYGIAHASLDKVSADDAAGVTEAWFLNSRNSRLGFKGSEDLGGGMKAVYKMEFSVDITDNGALGNRNTYVGISGGMGTVLLGRHDTAVKMSQGKFDVFNDTVADMTVLVEGEDRNNNAITYFSPKMGGMQVVAQLRPGETTANDGIADGTSLSFTYDAGGLYAALAMDSGDAVDDDMRLTLTYKMDALQVGFLYNVVSDAGAVDLVNDEKAMGLSAKFDMGDNAIKAMYLSLTDDGGTADADATAFTLGYDMNMSARTTVYALVTMISPDTGSAPSEDVNVVSLGLQHNF